MSSILGSNRNHFHVILITCYGKVEWRKLAKKLRRKRNRRIKAQLNDQNELEEFKRLQSSPSYQCLLVEKIKAETQQALEESQLREAQEKEWLKVEEEAQKQFQELQKKLAIAREERARQNEKIKLEWEEEQKRREEKRKQEEEELQRQIEQQELLNSKVEEFLESGGDTPEHLKTTSETNPNKTVCPFFMKTSTCRFFDVCSRNHVRPGISRILLIPNFFTHYSLEKTESDHTDSSLEFELHETREFYREFYTDVVPELETYGKIKLFVTCCNHEAHLRGNVFVEFTTTNAALKCYRGLNGRWYGGKQLSVQFVTIPSWKSAICGQHFSNRCPKGSSCNFIHMFKNPGNTYCNHNTARKDSELAKQRNHSESRNWRWSESPERVPINDDWEVDSNSSSRRRRDSVRNGAKKRRRSRSRPRERDRRSSPREKGGRTHSSKHKERGSSSRQYSNRNKSSRSRYS